MAQQKPMKPQIDTDQNANRIGNEAEGGVAPDMPAGNLGESIGGENSQASVRRVGQDEGKGSQGFGNE
jgi:hypothetical protein